MQYRTEHDTMGTVEVEVDKLWGAQTQRSVENFRIGPSCSMPIEIIRAFGYLKKGAALANHKLGYLSERKLFLILKVCDEIISGKLDEHFPLVVWQTGSGTQTNMNCNEVISNRAQIMSGKDITSNKLLHPNDDVNKSQSSNDTFPTAMNIAGLTKVATITLPGLERLRDELLKKSIEFKTIIKTGRTHMMDAVPLTLGQEFSGYVVQLDVGIEAIKTSLLRLHELALGGTAVGTGLNAPRGFDKVAVDFIAELTGFDFISAKNKFAALAAHDDIVACHGSLKQVAVSLLKISNDIRLMGSGPRTGIGELELPPNEPGSSIMPGKVNPTQVEAISMVCCQVMGNDVTISIAGASGQFELNVYKPLIINAFLQSARLLGDAALSFAENCVRDMQANQDNIKKHLDNSLMLVTALNTHIGYEKAAKVAKKAHEEKINLKASASALGFVDEDDFDELVDPKKMVGDNL